MHLALHLHAACADEAAADALDGLLQRALSTWSPAPARPPARDWTWPGTFSFAYTLSPSDESGFRIFVVRSGVRWELSGDAQAPAAAWSRDGDDRFLAPEVIRGQLWLLDEETLAWHDGPASSD